jgi:uncharacterized membrane-anchored protein
MRLLETIPHPTFRITIYLWNEKYLIKFETPTFEQVYKIPESFGDIERIKAIITSDFTGEAENIFLQMKKSLQAGLAS